MITDAIYNAALDAVFKTGTGTDRLYLSLHTDYSATGANLAAGSSKTAAQWAAAASRSKALNAATDITLNGSQTVKWIGYWGGTSGDTFHGMSPNGGSDMTFQLDKTANERIYCEGHGLVNDNKVVFHNDTAPTGLTAGTSYWVVGVTSGDPDYFQVSSSQGGAAINITGEAGQACVVSKIVEETYASNGTHRVSTLTIAL
ncbi:MAG: hypothetical protein IT518_25045 [Burkholderiales bacterium]|nr:hypothetical protein [Burkholderiales bacterium]